MLKMEFLLFTILLFSFLGLSGAGQENVQLLHLHDTNLEVSQEMSNSGLSLAISVSNDDLNGVSSSVLKAENWLKTHVLAYFPATKITTIIVGNNGFCHQEHNFGMKMILPSLKNIYYSLTRWGLEKEIKISTVFDINCFHPKDEKFTQSLLQFLHGTNSTYSIKLPSNFSPFSDESLSFISSITKPLKKFESFYPNKINLIVTKQNQQKQLIKTTRNLIETSLQHPIEFSVPANIAKNPHPPLSQPTSAPPPFNFPFSPENQPPPFVGPPSEGPFGYCPPCNPATAPAPEVGVAQELWCVAKPNVPAETLQEALDYACGDGGADCSEITPRGNCFYPDTVVAHASFAYNSYYQKNKRNGGTCSFGGTAMLIISDPSFLHCRFLLS
ncbi:glucan endo-1,3-beta-glucosidase 13 [Mercurialis annua]|uniref:glucan endo-1,3-beta-glucosidase 13 n=1 Tax=Mercurialis annua TaxID=3986 RepID=UPI00215F8D0B|nr:glucan endo-1,3-beta-glucosidase 13 [Mercurialis annua]